MSYFIAFIIIIVAAGALLLFNQQAEAPVTTEEAVRTEEAVAPAEEDTMEDEAVVEVEAESEAAVEAMEADVQIAPEAVMAEPATQNETYIAEASYFTPRRTEHDMVITLELAGTTIVDANITYDGGPANTSAHTGFDNAYAAEVIGADINEVQLSRVGGASLTSDAFNEAVVDIRAQL